MSGDFSRKTFNPEKHYSGVLKQQGRVDLDADWNEERDILQNRTQKETIDVIGASGAPKKGNSFKIIPLNNASDLVISPGHIYVGGLLCELEASNPPVTYFNQPYLPNPDSSFFKIIPGHLPSRLLKRPVKLKDGTYIVYLDAWQREVNYLDDPLIQEVALGEADTATRLQNVWQVKLLKVSQEGAGCKSDFKEWSEIITPPTGKLNAQTVKVNDSLNPCKLPPKGGYQRLENQLYRVEIQNGGDLKNTTFKWSRDNASVETRIESVKGSVITVADVGKDEVLGFSGGQWVEIVSEESTLKSTPFPLAQILSINPATREITLSSPSLPKNDGHLKLRRWDQSVPEANSDGLMASSGWTDMEGGIQVSFSPGTYHAGDFWLIPARTATGEIEWPPFSIPNISPVARERFGTEHFYCRLALINILSGKIVYVKDCRPVFPSLTEISASDIGVNADKCEFYQGADNVQQALDILCKNRELICTYHAIPGVGWESVFGKIKNGEDAQICFQIGEYPLEKAVTISEKGNLKITGCGPGTKIVASTAEAAIIFQNCQSVVVRDIYAETNKTGSSPKNQTENLKGTLTFLDCKAVNVQDVKLQCGEGVIRAATCITIRNTTDNSCAVHIRDCDLQIGHRQQGILLINVNEGIIENNRLNVYNKSEKLLSVNPGKSRLYRAELLSSMISEVQLGSFKKNVSSLNTTLKSGNYIIKFQSDSSLKSAWQDLVTKNPPQSVNNTSELYTHVLKLSDRLLTDPEFLKLNPAFGNIIGILTKSERATGFRAITVGGKISRDIKILNNTLNGFLQGIHVGLSHENTRDRDSAGNITIGGNSIAVVLTADAVKLERHGIFAGNCKSLIIENNNISLERLEKADKITIDGILVWGVLGGRLMISKNYLYSIAEDAKTSFDVGIHVNPLSIMNTHTQQWVIMWNVAPSKQNTVIGKNGVLVPQGTNIP